MRRHSVIFTNFLCRMVANTTLVVSQSPNSSSSYKLPDRTIYHSKYGTESGCVVLPPRLADLSTTLSNGVPGKAAVEVTGPVCDWSTNEVTTLRSESFRDYHEILNVTTDDETTGDKKSAEPDSSCHQEIASLTTLVDSGSEMKPWLLLGNSRVGGVCLSEGMHLHLNEDESVGSPGSTVDGSPSQKGCMYMPGRFEGVSILIVFDWDDTILPTTMLRAVGDGIAPLDQVSSDSCSSLAESVMDTLRVAAKFGEIVMITNGSSDWIQASCWRHLPTLWPMIDGIKKVSAKDRYEGDSRDPMDWKKQIFLAEIHDYFEGQNEEQLKVVFSIGDSAHERHALFNFYDTTPLKNVAIRSFKFVPIPSLRALQLQHRALVIHLAYIINSVPSGCRCLDLIYHFDESVDKAAEHMTPSSPVDELIWSALKQPVMSPISTFLGKAFAKVWKKSPESPRFGLHSGLIKIAGGSPILLANINATHFDADYEPPA